MPVPCVTSLFAHDVPAAVPTAPLREVVALPRIHVGRKQAGPGKQGCYPKAPCTCIVDTWAFK